MKKNELYNFYEKTHFFELERKEKIFARSQFCLTLLTSLIGVHGYLFASLKFYSHTLNTFAIILLFISTAFLVTSIVYCVKSFHGSEYKFFPTSEQIEKHRLELGEYYSEEKIPEGYPNAGDIIPDAAPHSTVYDRPVRREKI